MYYIYVLDIRVEIAWCGLNFVNLSTSLRIVLITSCFSLSSNLHPLLQATNIHLSFCVLGQTMYLHRINIDKDKIIDIPN